MQPFQLNGANGTQYVPVSVTANGVKGVPANGLLRLLLVVPGTLTAGTVTVEYLMRGSNLWRRVPNGLRNLTEANIEMFVSAEVENFRFTFAGVAGAGVVVGVLYTDPAMGFLPHHFTNNNGGFARLRVDVAQTSFFAGREWRTFKELNIANGTTLVVRATVGIDTILHSLKTSTDQGSLRIRTWLGGTPGGTFSETLPRIPKNRMSDCPVLAPMNSLDGGVMTFDSTGAVQLDVERLVAPNGQTQTVNIVGGEEDAERGIAVGTYYFTFENIGSGPITGVFRAHWEERQTNGA